MLGRVLLADQSPDSAHHGIEMSGEVTRSVSRLFSFPAYLELFVCACKVEAKSQPSPAAPGCSLVLHCTSINCPITGLDNFTAAFPSVCPAAFPQSWGGKEQLEQPVAAVSSGWHKQHVVNRRTRECSN